MWLSSKAIEPAGITHLIYFHGQKDNADSFHEAVYHQFSTLSTLILSIAYCIIELQTAKQRLNVYMRKIFKLVLNMQLLITTIH